ncbi:hypothetical protein EB796_006509 [Bugula neritina]|uniref:Uncharacterized protein n=1 Tax=Bugula neritina TaxID=10212 RepID=A0A7J7KAD3_BUGNE|nr:hypothetical protein EB796_006509 [Bugula neritina]
MLLLQIEHAQYGACCVNQDPPIITVEKLTVQARTRTVTVKQRIAGRCGVFGWDSCTRYTTNLVHNVVRFLYFLHYSYNVVRFLYFLHYSYNVVRFLYFLHYSYNVVRFLYFLHYSYNVVRFLYFLHYSYNVVRFLYFLHYSYNVVRFLYFLHYSYNVVRFLYFLHYSYNVVRFLYFLHYSYNVVRFLYFLHYSYNVIDTMTSLAVVSIHRKMMNIFCYCCILSLCNGINIAVNISTIYCGLCSPQQYYVQLYTHNTKYPPYLKNFSKVVTLLADWREKNPVGELKAALANILVKEKIFG